MKALFTKRTLSAILVMTLSIGLSLGGMGFTPRAEAAALTGLSDTMSSLKMSTASSHVIRFTTATGATDNTDTITITFPSDFNFTSKTIGTVSFTHGATTGAESAETLAASPSSTAWGAVFSGTQNRVLTLTAPSDGVGAAAVAPGDKIIISYDNTNSINPSSAAVFSIAIGGTFGDTGNILIQTLSDDQVQVSAVVAQTLTFSISDNSIGFGTLSSSAARHATGDETGGSSETEAHTLAVATNAASGYSTTVKGATLTSGLVTIDAIGGSNTSPSVGTEQFGLRLTASGGAGTVTAPYAASGFAYAADANTASQVAAATTASATTTYSVRYLANISTGTEAGAYAATLTYVTTANF